MNSSTRQSYFSRPAAHVFKWPIGLDVPNGPPDGTLLAQHFRFFMDVRVPLAIAGSYAILVHIANHFRRHNNKPLAFTSTRLFKALVILHNVGLCIYSAWTCVGMTSAIARTVAHLATFASPLADTAIGDILGADSAAAAAASGTGGGFWRALCDLNDGVWERGLSYYGYFFYLSKFYEVFDTVIILAKGRQSSLLQTYHHAGAMLSMWAGIRFASPPIWIFVVFNSLIHTIMYLYYTLSALRIRVPKALKRALTTAQITQFVAGGSFALLHLFVYYHNPQTGGYKACLADPGQSFALLFNVAYLAPLTYLFVSFWINSYVKGSAAAAVAAEKKRK